MRKFLKPNTNEKVQMKKTATVSITSRRYSIILIQIATAALAARVRYVMSFPAVNGACNCIIVGIS